jgi:hypothetical protein
MMNEDYWVCREQVARGMEDWRQAEKRHHIGAIK